MGREREREQSDQVTYCHITQDYRRLRKHRIEIMALRWLIAEGL
jgi:hypothetical protein